MPGMARAKRMGLLHFEQIGVGPVRWALILGFMGSFCRVDFAPDQPAGALTRFAIRLH
jgi:hypothetical protein